MEGPHSQHGGGHSLVCRTMVNTLDHCTPQDCVFLCAVHCHPPSPLPFSPDALQAPPSSLPAAAATPPLLPTVPASPGPANALGAGTHMVAGGGTGAKPEVHAFAAASAAAGVAHAAPAPVPATPPISPLACLHSSEPVVLPPKPARSATFRCSVAAASRACGQQGKESIPQCATPCPSMLLLGACPHSYYLSQG